MDGVPGDATGSYLPPSFSPGLTETNDVTEDVREWCVGVDRSLSLDGDGGLNGCWSASLVDSSLSWLGLFWVDDVVVRMGFRQGKVAVRGFM